MREVEIKAHVRDAAALEGALEALGCSLGEATTQEDTVYVKNAESMDAFLANDFFLRIRETAGRTVFTLKYHPDRTQAGDARSMPIEHELDVSSREELEAMLQLLGFSPAMAIRKHRRTGHYGEYEICLDSVDELGNFVEVERLVAHDEEIGPISDGMESFLASLGVAKEDIGVKRYDIQTLERRFGA